MAFRDRVTSRSVLIIAFAMLAAVTACGSDATAPRIPHSLGSPYARITIIEFADFQCPFCKLFGDTVEPKLVADFVNTGLARFEYRHYSFLGEESFKAAEASECAAEQGAFWQYRESLFRIQGRENSGVYTDTVLQDLAEAAGIDRDAFNECANSGAPRKLVDQDIEVANELGINSTPTLIIGNFVVPGVQDYTVYQQVVAQALLQAQSDAE